MMDESTRWTVKVSKETDVTLRTYLAQSGLRKGDLSKFIEEAVRWRVLDRTAAGVRERLGKTDPRELQALIDDAVRRVRSERAAHRRSEADTGKRARVGRKARTSR
jgi:Ribbon-helix-helix domain